MEFFFFFVARSPQAELQALRMLSTFAPSANSADVAGTYVSCTEVTLSLLTPSLGVFPAAFPSGTAWLS
jgi:hypothetical protein